MRYIMVFAVFLITGAWPCLSDAAITITNETTFHQPSADDRYVEDYAADEGGVLHVFVRNRSLSTATIGNVTINGMNPADIPGFRWWRVWPPSMGGRESGNSCCTVTIKSTANSPLSEGETVNIGVTTTRGASANQTYTCATPTLRIANALPDPTLRTLLVYLRNDGVLACDISRVWLNDEEHAANDSVALTAVGNDYRVSPGTVRILKIERMTPFPSMLPVALLVRAVETDTQRVINVGAPIRVFPAQFPLGTWSSDLLEEGSQPFFARKLRLDLCAGSNIWDNLNALNDRFFLQGLSRVPNPTANRIKAAACQPGLGVWMMDDEPDLGGVTAGAVASKELLYRQNDPNHPTYANLATMRAFNRYGMIPDVVSMDHYAMFSAPNVLPLTWFLRYAEMEESLAYTDQLKRNTEPNRMWAWAQLGGDWNRQPEGWGVDYQFWAHVMGGAKGILWFRYAPGDESRSSLANGVAAAMRATRVFSQVRNLCLYGETVDNVLSAPEKAHIRSLVSEDAAVIIAINDNYSITGQFYSPVYEQYPLEGVATVRMPDWIPVETVFRVTENGPVEADYLLEDRDLTLGISMRDQSQVFVVGRRDSSSPPAPPAVQMFPKSDASGCAVTWKEPMDNYGVRGYKIYRNGQEVADTPYPLYELESGITGFDTFAVAAYDAAENLGPRSETVRLMLSEFVNSGYNDGWSLEPAMSNPPIAADGVLRYSLTGGALRLVQRQTLVDTSDYTHCVVRVANMTQCDRLILGWREDASLPWNTATIAIAPQAGDFRTYVIDLSALSEWTGTVSQLFIEPSASTPVSGEIAWDLVGFTSQEQSRDDDRDNLNDLEEWKVGTDPYLSDSDGDRIDDGEEIRWGYDPTDPTKFPQVPVSNPVALGVLFVVLVFLSRQSFLRGATDRN